MLIAIFSVQTFSTSEFNSQKQYSKNSDVINSPINQISKLGTKNSITSSNTTNTSNILSISNLFNYLSNLSGIVVNSFVDSPTDYLNTTITVARAFAILKILGFTGYIIDINNINLVVKYFNDFGPIKSDGGYPILNGLPDSSIAGTYGVLETVQLLNLFYQESLIKVQTQKYLLSKFYVSNNQAGFKEDYQTNVTASIASTYYAIEALKVLNYKGFNQTQMDQINQFLYTLWTANSYFSNANDPDQSIIITSFEAISILQDLNSMGSTNTTLYNTVQANFPNYLAANQDKTGKYVGGLHDPTKTANVDDTGSGLTALYMLNKLNAINVTSAIQFIINSQYNGTHFTNQIGGFSSNNGTTLDSNQFSDVKLSHTYYAILGLYSSSYLYNLTKISIQTDYSKNNNLNDNTNELLVGQNQFFSAQFNTLNYKNYYDSANLEFQINKLEVQSNFTTDTNNTASGSFYNFMITNSSNSNFYIGIHNFNATFSLNNFSIIPVINYVFHGYFVVRLPIISKVNGISTTLEVNPGDLLQGEVYFDNNTVNATNFRTAILGNISVSLVLPNSTSIHLNNGNNFSLVITNSTYFYNYTLPNDAILGDYMVNLTYTNASSTYFYTQQIITVSTNVNLVAFTSTLNDNIYPGSNYSLTFQVEYQNGYMNPHVTTITAFFSETNSHVQLFNTTLTSVGSNKFSPLNSEKVPIGLFMGSYNVSLELVWNSTTTGNTLIRTATNSTLDVINYVGTPIIRNDQLAPAFNRNNKNLLYSGDFLNFTANVYILNSLSTNVYQLNDSVTFTATLTNTSNPSQVLQELTTIYLNDTKISAYGEVNPNLNQLNDVNLTLTLKIKYISTNSFNLVYKSANVLYKPTFLLKKADLALDTNSVHFIIGNSIISQNSYTTLLVTFKISSMIGNNESQYVSGLKLNSSLVFPASNGKNQSEILLPSITSLDTNKSYQLQIPVSTLNIGTYQINITTLNTNVHLGTFSLTIQPMSNNDQIPIQNFIAVGAVGLAVVVTIIANSLNKRKK